MNFSKILWIFFSIMIFETVTLSNSLTEDHVCSRIENYTITSYETYTEPVVVNTFTWCLQIPPRCPKTRTELRQRYRIKMEEKSKIVKECCEGYKMLMTHDDTETNERCSPFCEKCLAGVCIAPNKCQCNPGYHGDDCARGCPIGTWGLYCMEVCDCGENGICDPINGVCRCSSGLQGLQCQEQCEIGQWGPDCANKCICQNWNNNCDAVTGRCTKDNISLVEQTSSTYLRNSTTERVQTPRVNNIEYTKVVSPPRETTERQTKDINDNWNTNYISETTSPTTASIAISPQKTTTNEMRIKNHSTTARPIIVLVSVPEHRKDIGEDKQKFATKNAFFRHVKNNENIDVPNIDYVQTIHKGIISTHTHKDNIQTSAPIPLDIALIVVAAIISFGLTSLAVVMILHMRSKLFETVRLAIYDDEKTKNQKCESVNGGRLSTVVNASLPSPPIRVNPVFATSTEPETILTVDGIESLNTYANGAATIGLRISGNLHDLLQDGHYDRPSATLIRLQTNFDPNTEHVYDEIPLQTTPLSSRKNV